MSDQAAPVEQTAESSGQAEGTQQASKDSVAYETHQRLLSEKKKLQEKFEALQSEKAEREKKEMEARGEFQKIAELEKEKRLESERRLAELENTFVQGKKAKAFLKALGSEVDEKYYGFLPFDDILVDPDTKEINMTSVASAVDSFRKTYPEILRVKDGPKMPNIAPAGNGAGTISRADWLKLPSKDMAKFKPHQIIGD